MSSALQIHSEFDGASASECDPSPVLSATCQPGVPWRHQMQKTVAGRDRCRPAARRCWAASNGRPLNAKALASKRRCPAADCNRVQPSYSSPPPASTTPQDLHKVVAAIVRAPDAGVGRGMSPMIRTNITRSET